MSASTERQVAFKSGDAKKRIVWAEVYAPDRPDSDNEFMRADHIEKMAYDYMRAMKLDSVDHQHDQVNKEGCCVVESFIARKGDPDFIEGAWVVGMHIANDDLWAKVEKGEINGFSMEALVLKETKDVTMEVPPVLSGVTMKSEGDGEDHTHEFMVAYSEEGVFRGGKTNTVNDHFHIIKRGTTTEDAGGHKHKFAHVENLRIN
jgi:hypothetical protein